MFSRFTSVDDAYIRRLPMMFLPSIEKERKVLVSAISILETIKLSVILLHESRSLNLFMKLLNVIQSK